MANCQALRRWKSRGFSKLKRSAVECASECILYASFVRQLEVIPVLRFARLSRPVVFAAALLLCFAAFSQQPDTGAGPQIAPPIPPALRAAKSIFVSNAGGDSGLFPSPSPAIPAADTQSSTTYSSPPASTWSTIRLKPTWFSNSGSSRRMDPRTGTRRMVPPTRLPCSASSFIRLQPATCSGLSLSQ